MSYVVICKITNFLRTEGELTTEEIMKRFTDNGWNCSIDTVRNWCDGIVRSGLIRKSVKSDGTTIYYR